MASKGIKPQPMSSGSGHSKKYNLPQPKAGSPVAGSGKAPRFTRLAVTKKPGSDAGWPGKKTVVQHSPYDTPHN